MAGRAPRPSPAATSPSPQRSSRTAWIGISSARSRRSRWASWMGCTISTSTTPRIRAPRSTSTSSARIRARMSSSRRRPSPRCAAERRVQGQRGACLVSERRSRGRRRDPMTARRRLLVATRSPHKLAELRDLLALQHADLVSLDDVGAEGEPEETGATFESNGALKARAYARLTGLPTLADDSGLEVDALDGGPGVRTRRYSGPDATDARNNAKLLAALEGLPPERRGGRYVCVLAFADPRSAGPRSGVAVRTVRG